MIYLYVVKNKDSNEYMTPTLDFAFDILLAEFFLDYETAKFYCPFDCKILKYCLTEVKNEKENG